jgi:tRNA (cmo5U34)-methyltransferase
MHRVADAPAARGGGKAGLLAAVAARLKPGAPLVLADLHAEAGGARFNRLVAAWRDWQLAAGIPPEDVDKGFRHIVKDIRFVPEGRILDLLHGAGFAAVEPFYGAYLFGGWIAWKG